MSSANKYATMVPISWEQLQCDCRSLAQQLLQEKPFKGICAIARGGLVPAAILAREMNIHLIDTLCISSYDWKTQGDPGVLKGVAHDGRGWLLIDDLVDTGKTAEIVRKMMPQAYFATVYAKPAGRPLVDTCITEFAQDAWVLFPWDSAIQFTPPLVKISESE
ncbi:MAG: xanthine phosphoribosyltransferase [Sedimenticola sp.]